MRHGIVTILATLRAGEDAAALEQRLRDLGTTLRRLMQTPNGNPPSGTDVALLQPLVALPGLHFASFFFIPSSDVGQPAYVGLEISCDETAAAFRRRLVADASVHPILIEIFRACSEFPTPSDGQPIERGRLGRFLKRNDCAAQGVFVGCPGRSVEQICTESELRRTAREELSTLEPQNARDAWTLLRRQKRLADIRQAPESRPFWVRWGLNRSGLRARVRQGMGPLRSFTIAGASLLGLYLLLTRGTVWIPWPIIAVPALLVACEALLVVRELPNQLSLDGKSVVYRSALFDWLRDVLTIGAGGAGLLGAIDALFAWTATHPASLYFWLMALLAVASLVCSAALATAALGALRAIPVSAPLALVAYMLVQQAASIDESTWSIAQAVAAGVTALGLTSFCLLPTVAHVLRGREWGTLLSAGLALGWCVCALAPFVSPWQLALGASLLWLLSLSPPLALLYCVRRRELDDTEADMEWDTERLERVQAHEDYFPQNHLAVVSRVRAGRLFVLHAVLRLLSFLALVYFNQGYAGRVRTLHFIRFIVLPDPSPAKRLLFLSNYDGGFGAYLHDFSSIEFVTAAWSCTEGFPRSTFLFGAGAHDEQRYKAVARRDQIPTLGWWSAYPALSVADIDRATELREDLEREALPDRPSARQQRKQRFALRPLMSEAECERARRNI